MHIKEFPKHSFRSLGEQLGLEPEMFDDHLVVHTPMWRKALSAESRFCKAVVAAGYLTERQMRRAAWRYRLGISRQGGVIFWQIDQEQRIHDGKVMYYQSDCHRDKHHHPTWVSTLLCRRYHWHDCQQASHCFFGLHLLTPSLLTPTAIVEAEKTAVILSERYPQYLWLATGGLGEVQADKFRPLKGRKVVLFPDTDPDGIAYRRWYEAAQQVMQQPFWEDSPPIYVSPLLERHATPEQKTAKIDLIDFVSN